jgi:oxygen-dependent protoporphyrinogen oxidase
MSAPGARRVLVLGGGLAGLAAAWRLARAGLAVELLEREATAGGRAAPAPLDGLEIDPAAHRVSTGDRALRRVLSELGRERELVALSGEEDLQLQRGRLVTAAPADPFQVARLPGVRGLHALRLFRLARLLRQHASRLDPAVPEKGVRLDDRSVGDFARLYFGASVLERWIAPALAAEALAGPEEASRLLFLLRHAAHADASPARLAGGPGALVRALAEKLPVRLRAEAVAVEAPGEGALRVRLRGGDPPREADALLLALPAGDAARLAAPLLVGAERDFFAGARDAAALTLAVRLAGPRPPRSRHVAVSPREGLAVVSLAIDQAAGTGGIAVLRAGDAFARAHAAAPDDTVAKELLPTLAKLQPGAAPGATRVFRWPAALPRFDVGRYRALERFQRVQRDRRAAGRRLYFAGDWLVDPSIEGALRAGERAAAAVLEDFAVAAR